jgi:hypothetical protein
MRVLPSLRSRAHDDLIFMMVGSLGEHGSVKTTLGEHVSGVCISFTVGMRGRPCLLDGVCRSPF